MDPKERRAIYVAMARVLAAIHSVNVDAIGLGQYGRKENYCKRQVCDFFISIGILFDLFELNFECLVRYSQS